MFQSLRQRFPWRPSPIIIAVALSVLLILWLASGEKRGAKETAPEQPAPAESGLPQVEVRWSDAQPLPHAARERADPLAADVGQPDPLEQLGGPPVGARVSPV